MTSHDTAWVPLPDGKAAASTCRSRLTQPLWWLPASSGCTARGWGATGRGSGVLQAGGPSCSTHNPWPVDPHPRGAGRLEPTRGRGRSRTMTTGTQRRRRSGDGGGGPETEAPGYTATTPDSLLRGPVSTALTSTSPPPKFSTGIVGILRFFFGAQRRCACDVSTMDTSDLPDLFPSTSPSPPGPPACPGFPSERVPQKS